MVECQTFGCKLAVGKNGRKGFCQKCYRKTLAKSDESLNCSIDIRNDSQDLFSTPPAHLFSTPPASLNQSLLVPDIVLENASFKTQEKDYVTIPETPPQSVNEMFAMLIQMKEDYNLQLKKRDEAIASLSLCVTELQEEVKKQEAAQKVNGISISELQDQLKKKETTQKQHVSEGERVSSEIDPSSQQPIEELKETVELQKKTVHQQQVFLEHLANKDRVNNLIITGIPEGDDTKSIDELITSLLPEENIKNDQDFQMKRLGNNDTARKPRPILLQFHQGAINKRKKMLQNNKKLKDIERFNKVYIKPDQHPVFRKEHMRLRKVAYEERKKPENQGCNVVYKGKEGVVTKDGIVIDKLSIHFQ